MTVYDGVIKTLDHGSIRLQAIGNLKLKRGNKSVQIIPDRPSSYYQKSSTKITTLLSKLDASKLSKVSKSEDHFGDFHIYKDGIIIGVVECCDLQNIEIHTSLVTGITNATFRLYTGTSRHPTRIERIECGINRLKKVEL
jgi:hypothetical protein